MPSDIVSDYIVLYPQGSAIPQPAAGGPSEIFNIVGWFQGNGYGGPPEGQKVVKMHAPEKQFNGDVVDFPSGDTWDDIIAARVTVGEPALDEPSVLAFRIYPLYLPEYFEGDNFQFQVTINGHRVFIATTLYDHKPGNTCYRSVHEILPGKITEKDPNTGKEEWVPLWKPKGNKVVFEHVKGKGGVSICDVVVFYKRRVTFASEAAVGSIDDRVLNLANELAELKSQIGSAAAGSAPQMLPPPRPGHPEADSGGFRAAEK